MSSRNIKQDTITRDAIAKSMKLETGLSIKDSTVIVDQIFSIISQQLSENNIVKIRHFGTFKTRYKPARLGRNPKTLATAMIAARTVVTFKVSPNLKNKINLYSKYTINPRNVNR